MIESCSQDSLELLLELSESKLVNLLILLHGWFCGVISSVFNLSLIVAHKQYSNLPDAEDLFHFGVGVLIHGSVKALNVSAYLSSIVFLECFDLFERKEATKEVFQGLHLCRPLVREDLFTEVGKVLHEFLLAFISLGFVQR